MLFPKLYFGQNREPSKCDKGNVLETCKEFPVDPASKEVKCDICKATIHKQLFVAKLFKSSSESKFIAHESCVEYRDLATPL